VLYISYDGMLEPLGQSQVLRYLQKLAPDHRIILVSFEKQADWQDVSRRSQVLAFIRASGITWIPLRYHKRPSALATAFDIAHGIVVGAYAIVRYRVRLLHARSYVASVMALVLKKAFGKKFIFDMRGFWADERVDGGLWPADGALYRTAKWFERQFLLNADCVVSLTYAAVEKMQRFPYLQGRMPRFEVITTCADLEIFRPEESVDSIGRSERGDFVLGYVGSVGVWYLFDEALRFFLLLKEQLPQARLQILNRGDHAYIRERIACLAVDPNDVRLEVADNHGVAKAMRGMDAGIFFIKPAYSKIASAPTKLGEFLGCGVPCIGNTGVGDMAEVLESNAVGIALGGFDEISMRQAIQRLIPLSKSTGMRMRCRNVALRLFSLNEGVRIYNSVYQDLLQQHRA
jgi:glycosyltransferase involved in cell wall biosynthesis